MKQSLFIFIVASLLFITPVFASHAFPDVWDSSPYHDSTAYLKEKGVIGGYPDGSFKPDLEIKRVEVLKILLESAKIDVPAVSASATAGFKDVLAGAWYVKYVKKAKTIGIVKGYPDGTFHPTETVKLGEALKMALETHAEFVKLYNFDPLPLLPTDVKSSDWFAIYVQKALFAGLIDKDEDGKVKAGKALNRGGFADIIYRLLVAKEKRLSQITTCPCTVALQSMLFHPNELLIHQGSKVTFSHADGVSHQIESETFSSPVLFYGQTFEVTFPEKGIFSYRCKLHTTEAQGTIEVIE